MVPRLVATAAGLVLLAPGVASATSLAPPSTVISIGLSPASPRAGSEVRLTGGAGAPVYAWDFDGDGHFDDARGKEVTASFPAGTHTVQAQAATAVGMVTDSRTFTVHDWNVPPGGTVSVKPYTSRVGVPVTVTAKGSDPDGLTVQTALDLDGDGSFETTGTTGTATFATAGERVIRARFTDDAGASSVATTTLEVHTGNIAPTAEFVNVAGLAGSTATDGAYGLQVWAEDPDGEVVRYEFDLDGDGTFETDNGRRSQVPENTDRIKNLTARVTDDGGAVAIARRPEASVSSLPRVVQVGVPATLSMPDWYKNVVWDADGDGDYDDGTGNQISFTYPAVGTYDVRIRATVGGSPQEFGGRTSARAAADIAVPLAQWHSVPTLRAAAPAYFSWYASGPTSVEANLDLNGDGVFAELTEPSSGFQWASNGPITAALKVTDSLGRSAVTTSDVPFVPGDLGPDAVISTFDIEAPLHASYPRGRVFANGSDADDGTNCCSVAWDADNDGEYDDGEFLGGSIDAGNLPSSFGVRATDAAGVSTTLRRTVAPLVPHTAIKESTPPKPERWLRLTPRSPRLATVLRRGLTVDVKCTKPKCRTSLVAKVDAKTARKLRLRSRIVGRKTVSGSRQVRLQLTPKAKRALKRVRSVKLTLTATATAEGGARSTSTKTLTIHA